MRGRVNLVDLIHMPFNYVHELYRYTFTIKELKEKNRLDEEKARKEKEDREKKKADDKKSNRMWFEKRLSPAAQAQANKKSQVDDSKKSEDNITTELSPPKIDIEELSDMLEEGI